MKYRVLIGLLILIVLVFGSAITYSLFHSSSQLTSTNQNIAKFIFNAETLDQLELSLTDLNPGDMQEYSFSVSNNDAEIISQVSVQYQMTIKTYHLVPLVIELYYINGDTEELVITCDETYSRNLENELMCNTPIKEMAYSSSKLDNYKLKVSFPSEYNDASYSGLVDYINIEIKSWQKTEG